MLTQHRKVVARYFKRVKTVAALAIVTLLTSMPAQASDIQTTTYKITIKRAELATDAGVENVYERFHIKAKRACKYTSVYPSGEWMPKNACISDLVDQFVTSAQVPALSAHHRRLLREVS